MPAQTVNYQCPACMGPLHFSGETGKLQCDYCGSQYDPAEIERLYHKKEEAAEQAFDAASDVSEKFSWTPEGMRAYCCPSCGAEVVCDETTAATSCPYCGNPTVVPGQFSGMQKPDYMIPFRLDKNAAITALKRYYKGKKFLPRAFSANNHITEIQGVYVPFWLFDGTAEGTVRADAQQIRSWTEGDYEITETEEYKVLREGNAEFQRIPVDGSTKMPDAHMDSIEPFDYADLTDFSTAYLPGFLAEKYDVDKNESQTRATERMEESLSGLLGGTIDGYSAHQITGQRVHFEKVGAKYALLPVWMLHIKWKSKDYLFAMNGQTGKLIGDLPVSKGKFAAWMAGISLPLMALLLALTFTVSAFAWQDHGSTYTAIDALDSERFTAQGEISLPALSQQISLGLHVDIVDDLEGESINDYAALFYNNYGYGIGSNQDGALLMIYAVDHGGTIGTGANIGVSRQLHDF